MSRVSKINHSLILGFEEFERALDHAAELQTDSYPPFNIERSINKETGQEVLKIILAIAGFSADLLEVLQEGQKLVITGKKGNQASDNYLHKGIAMRQFQRSFILADSIEIISARLKDGLLAIELRLPEPKTKTRKIEIITT